MNNNILDFAIIASGIIGYFTSISLISSSFYKNRANNYLSLSLFLLTSLTLLGWFDIENTVLDFLNNPVLEYLVAVTLFSYFLIQIQHKYLQKSWYKWLYLPFIASFIIETIVYLDSIFNIYNSVFNDLIFHVMDNASFIYNVFLIFWSRKLVKHSNTISEDKKRWLLRLNFFIICIILSWLLSNIEFYVFDSEYTSSLLWISLSFLSWWILYYGVFKLQIIVQKDEIHKYLVTKKANSTSTKRKINETTVSNIISKLYELMDEEELYKNPLLSRLDIATRLGTSERDLSQVINQETNKNVIQFVNEYRIKAAKELLHDPVFNKYSVEAIGMESGFKSKSAFYNAFNSSLGMSPGAYRKFQKTS
ncbi:AraC family transcriptional regulator [Aquimarina sp. AD10]|uniref:helix-turn-helix domain-containing protein n=1 Tax=Aquimarina sp. AD10 TaxID=1714849 RepID=UPI000E49E090|nr:helix-turn-helix domain-containing protein [Aquimarina sp. AD10]AXT59559.1 AraC family transcriptional regulator [Aquimarina sp. AD10]RKM93458.1 helix-turn-helix domain-containing protein [Aquimarina sp. AD10]